MNQIYELLINNTHFEPETGIEYLYYGFYYAKIVIIPEQMLKYYQKSAELNNSGAMNNIGFYYDTFENSWEQALPWYQKAVELNDSSAIYNLAHYYLYVEKNPEKALETYMLNKEENKNRILDLLNNNPELFFTIYLKQQTLEKENLKLKSKVVHYKYRPKGFLNAEKHFVNLSKTS